MSSREGMPVDVRTVVGDPGEGRVPGGKGGCLDVVLRLNADMARVATERGKEVPVRPGAADLTLISICM